MSAESEVRQAWAAFVEKAKAAQSAGLDIRLPGNLNTGLGVSETAKAHAPSIVAEPIAEAAPEPQADPGDENPEPAKRKTMFSRNP